MSTHQHHWNSRPIRAVSAAAAVTALLVGAAGCGSPSTAAPAPSPPSAAASTSAPGPSSGPTAGTQAPTAGSGSAARPAASKVKPVPAESNPPGDIPDNIAFVPYTNRAGGYTFDHPEGWAQTETGTAVRFTDKLNGVAADTAPGAVATLDAAKNTEVARLTRSVPAFELKSISSARTPAGNSVRIVFRRNSDADPVTGRVYRDEVEEYLIPHAGGVLRLAVFGPVGADNVDAYRTIVESVKLS